MPVPFKVDLSGKVAAVTGGSGVLCSRMAVALAECGARVAVLSRRQEAVDAVAREIRDAGGEAVGISCDVLDRESVTAANRTIAETYGPIDILINGAGGNHPKGTASVERLRVDDLKSDDPDLRTFFELDSAAVSFVFDLNFMGTLLPTQIFARSMAERESGTILNISSMAAFLPLTKVAAYSAAKAAIDNFTRWLAVHMSRVGVRVNAIAPGFYLTEQNRTLLTQEDGSLTPRGETIVSQTPVGRFGQPDELIGTLLWLVDDKASSFVTGIVVPVDGGFSAFSGV
jgi:NAD(P)-dependent dehydrogenase (short-subunit alcohol dehydrogenase family)